MFTFLLIASLLVYISTSCDQKLSFFDSAYFSTITFFTVGFGDITLKTVIGRLISMFIGGTGALFMGLFVTSLYSSFQQYADYKNRIPHDKNVLRVLGEIRQDYLNILGNYHLTKGDFNFKWTIGSLREVKDDVYSDLIGTNVPDLSGKYHPFGKDAFMRSAEIVDTKIQNLLLIDFDTNFKSEVKYIALLSRNLVNNFHWSFFKQSILSNHNRDFVDLVFIVGDEKNASIVMQYIILKDELGILIQNIAKQIKNTE